MDFIDHRSTANFIFSLSATDEKLRIKSDGNVGIGVSNPSTKLEVDGVITTAGLTTTADINFGDNDKAIFGAGSDLQLYHDGSNSYIWDNGTGLLQLRTNGSEISLVGQNGTEFMGRFQQDGAVKLYYDNSQKFSTTSTGIDVTGVITTDGITTSADINFGDNDKAVFGAGSDLQIYHDGGNSLIEEAGVGNLIIRGSSNVDIQPSGGGAYMARFAASGASSLYHNGSEKLATTSTGIDVTGTVTADGLTVDGTGDLGTIGNGAFNAAAALGFQSDRAFFGYSSSQNALIQSGASKGVVVEVNSDTLDGGTRAALFASNGDISFYEDTGTTAKLFWDAADEQLQLTAPVDSPALNIKAAYGTATERYGAIKFENTSYAGANSEIRNFANGASYVGSGLSFFTSQHGTGTLTQRMTLDRYGNVGIGTSTNLANGTLNVESNGTSVLQARSDTAGVNDGDTTVTALRGVNSTAAKWANTNYYAYSHKWGIGSGASSNSAMTLDASGNLLVGKTASNTGVAGMELRPSIAVFTTDGDRALQINRLNSDGELQRFIKDGATVGSIGTRAGFLTIGEGAVGLLFQDANSRIEPTNMATLAATNGVVDIGGANQRFKDLYLSGTPYIGGTSAGQSVIQMLANPTNGANTIHFGDSASGSDTYAGYINYAHDSNSMQFATNQLERMRLDASGNLLVGKTTTSNATAGAELNASGQIVGTFAGGTHILGRNTNDGSILEFQKDGSTVGSIGTVAGDMFLGTTSTGVRFLDANNEIIPITVSSGGGSTDGTISLGGSPYRFKDLYLSGTAYTNALGVGTTSPDVKVDIVDTAADVQLRVYKFDGTNNTRLSFTADDSGAKIHYRDATNGGSLRFNNNAGEMARFDASGNFLVGKTSANNTAQGTTIYGSTAPGAASFVRDSGNTLVLNRLNTDGEIVAFRKDGTSVGSIGNFDANNMYIGSGDTGIAFQGTADRLLPIDASTGSVRNAAIDMGYSGGRFKDLYLSGGVYLGGTGSANHLDDYEEGTFTPTLGGSTTNPTVTYAIQSGVYTKIGNLVTATVVVGTSANTGGAGSMQIKGLPFNAKNASEYRARDMINTFNLDVDTNCIGVGVEGVQNGDYLLLLESRDNAIWRQVDWTQATAASIYFAFTFQYYV